MIKFQRRVKALAVNESDHMVKEKEEKKNRLKPLLKIEQERRYSFI